MPDALSVEIAQESSKSWRQLDEEGKKPFNDYAKNA